MWETDLTPHLCIVPFSSWAKKESLLPILCPSVMACWQDNRLPLFTDSLRESGGLREVHRRTPVTGRREGVPTVPTGSKFSDPFRCGGLTGEIRLRTKEESLKEPTSGRGKALTKSTRQDGQVTVNRFSVIDQFLSIHVTSGQSFVSSVYRSSDPDYGVYLSRPCTNLYLLDFH
ncbi:Hypothetical predicted protein [Marmota monax]|uniref:Uncharacterized protein n=1 Tax=Marmota monax TaxID=9995 RepID=A0A5E4CAE2_MARMO|nr:Hypothetical predicted protein [Marmota monax]